MQENVRQIELQTLRFQQLQRALAQGWQVEPPVYLRIQWHDPDKGCATSN